MKKFLSLVLVAVFSGCAVPQLPRNETSLGNISKFFAAIESADSVTVYEGLPHQTWEGELRTAELRRSDLIHIEAHPFYAQPLNVSADEKKKITEIALRKEAHEPFSGHKFCGGYHPDYAIMWEKNGQKSGSLICFGCHEWKNFTPRGRLYEDLGQAAYEELRSILARYVVHRPKIKKADQPTAPALTPRSGDKN
jgi:hypothetical protein